MTEIRPKQRKAIQELLAGATVEMAALTADVSERTVYLWLADDVFKAELNRRRDQLLDAAVTAVTVATVEAIAVLRDIQADDGYKASTRVSAARAILDSALRLNEQRNILQRLAELEDRTGP